MRPTLLAAALAASLALPAQQTMVKPFQPSPAATLTQDLGSTTVKIEYSRPGVKGRTIWGGLVPYNEVWRAGANNATVITFSDPVKIAGKDVPAGSYAFFAIPGPKTWTLILNKSAKQWGAYAYKPEEDLLRMEVAPTALPAAQEYLQYAVQVKGPDALRIELAWEKLSVGFDVSVDTTNLYWAYLEKTLAGAKADENVPFLQGARYCLSSGTHLDQGMIWIDKALQAKETFSALEVKAKLLQKSGKVAEALPLLRKAKAAATEAKAPKEYLDGLDKTLAEWAKK